MLKSDPRQLIRGIWGSMVAVVFACDVFVSCRLVLASASASYRKKKLQTTKKEFRRGIFIGWVVFCWELLKGVGVDGAGGNLPFFFAFLRFSSLFFVRESPLFLRLFALYPGTRGK